MIRVGDRFNVEVPTKTGTINEIWTAEKMDANENVTVKVQAFVRGELVERKTRKREELVTLMVWAHNGARLNKGTGKPLRRLVTP